MNPVEPLGCPACFHVAMLLAPLIGGVYLWMLKGKRSVETAKGVKVAGRGYLMIARVQAWGAVGFGLIYWALYVWALFSG